MTNNTIENARLIAAAPELLSAAVEAEQALADIVGAADNGDPYTAQELAGFAAEAASKLYAAIAKARR